jgi:urease accessory protein
LRDIIAKLESGNCTFNRFLPQRKTNMSLDTLKLLRLMQLADTTFPIGAAAHSLGIETLAAEGTLDASSLLPFLQAYLVEIAAQEGLFCRAAHRIYSDDPQAAFETAWLDLNRRLSAFKLARESRKASAMLGKRFLQLVCTLEQMPALELAYAAALAAAVDIHHATAFGLVGAALGADAETVLSVYLQQTTLSLISACQRLMPLGQVQAAQILWALKPNLLAAAHKSQDGDLEGEASYAFPGLVEMAGMRHPTLPTRLFIS